MAKWRVYASGSLCFILTLWCVMHAGAAVQIIEFCPDPHSFMMMRMSILVFSGNGSLDGITISDGEGGFRFPTGDKD